MLGETYERSYNHNYMILQAKEREYPGFSERIIQENEVPGLLSCQFRVLEGTLYFYYEISGKRTLGQLFQKQKIGAMEMRRLLLSLSELQRESERYLLDFRKYILLPEYLYADFDIQHLYAVYYPDYEGEDMLEEIGCFLIEHVNYQEAEAVEPAYSFQQKIMEENVNLQLVAEELLREKKEALAPTYEEKQIVREEVSSDDMKADSEVYVTRQEPIPRVLLHDKPKQKRNWQLAELKCLQEIREFLRGLFIFKKKEKRRKDKPVYEMELELGEDREVTPFFRTPVASEATQFFSCNEGEELRCLVYQGRGKVPDLDLEVFPYIIGKGEKGIDGKLDNPSISRIHSQLDYINEAYFITDLNSTNGTFLNGERLPPNIRTKLSVGDRIQFAGEKFIFQ